jgi:ribosomal RNA-processing protein 7
MFKMSKIGDYAILPLAIAPSTSPTPTTHTLYLRPHAPKIPTEDDSRSLFVVNVPVDSTPAHFRAVFVSLIGAGRFESITFEHDKQKPSAPSQAIEVAAKRGKKRKRAVDEDVSEVDTQLPPVWDRELRRSGSTAIVVLVDETSAEAALKAVRKLHKSSEKEGKWPVWGEGVEGKVPALGSARYLTHHKMRYPDAATLQANVDALMTDWNRREEEKARLAKRQRNVPDEDGFVTVTRGGRVGPARMHDAEAKRLEMEEKEKKKKAELSEKPFYRFQMREIRKAEQAELVKRFEEDKARLQGMKEKRGKFVPER